MDCKAKYPIITIVNGDDWAGLYIDGQLFSQGHDIYAHHWRSLIQHVFGVNVEHKTADDEWLNNRGDLPDNLAEVEMTDDDE